MKKVLILEDDRDTLDILEYVIIDLNLDVTSSNDAMPVSAIETLSPDLILSDHRMPARLGGELCYEIKSDPAISHIPVIMLSADRELVEIADKSCADDYLQKPFDLEDLIALIKKYV